MARPTRDTIENGLNGWDATINDNLIKVFDGPFAIHEHTGDESDLQATFPAASYDRCLVWVDHSVDGWTLYQSDGSSWAEFAAASTFLDLSDAPSSYSGEQGKLVAVNSGETALEFIDPATVGTTDFTGLDDTPGSYSGQAGQTLKVNAGETALEFTALTADAQNLPIVVAVGDETTTLTTGTDKVTFRMPFPFTVTEVRASLTTASSSGVVTIDINEGGSSILSTKLTIDASETTSTSAATPAVISDANLADDAEITIDIDGAGTGAAGLKVMLIGTTTANQNFNTTETATGQQWHDGSDVYRKVIDDSGSGTYSTGTVTFAHGITGLDQLVNIYAVLQRDNGDQLLVPFSWPAGTGDDDLDISLLVDSTNVNMNIGPDWDGTTNLALSDAQIIIEYTKT